MGEHRIIDIVPSSSQLTKRREESVRRMLRIPEHLRTENRRTYVPQVLSLGPLHYRSKPELDEYETLKAELLRDIFSSTTRQIKEQVEVMILDQQFITRIRQWYALPDCARRGDEDKELGWMMARDGFCLLEALREISPDYRTSRINPKRIFQRLSFGFAVEEDIMKLENQIPLFVLQKILECEIKIYQEEVSTDQDLIFSSILRQAQHTLFPFFPYMRDWQDWHKLAGVSLSGDSHLLGFVYENIIRSSHSTDRNKCNNNRKGITLPTAVQLKRKGVEFAADVRYLKEIHFDDGNGTFHLPATQVHKGVVAVMQNLLAFESLARKDETKPLKSYVDLMRSLIKTAADIKVLTDGGILIIKNDLDTDEEVANVWNRMWKGPEESEYEPIETAVDKVATFYGSSKHRMIFAEAMPTCLPAWAWKRIKAAVSITMVLALLQTIFGWEQLRLQLEFSKKG